MAVDKIYRLPRVWSNKELKKFAHLFHTSVVNCSGWKDADKEGSVYRDYFYNSSSYHITNYKAEMRGFQGKKNELFLDLEAPVPNDFPRFDVVFSHTVLEHVFELETAFMNLCKLSKDLVIIVVPFLQEQHAAYGDYWRFTPLALERLFEKNGLNLIYVNANNHRRASVYIFAIASRHSERWGVIRKDPDNMVERIKTEAGMIGRNVIANPLTVKVELFLKRCLLGQDQ